jgi:hypothetical protein
MWLALVVLTLAIFFASLPVYLAQLQTPCAGTTCWYTQLSPGQVRALKMIGLSPGVYAAYTVALTLASVVLCLVVGLQYLLGGLISQTNDVAIVVSTLVIAFLFQPLRRHLQIIIDRRFYRRKYDAARILAAFSTTLRNEVDLQQLREQLVAVVEETMQPTIVSLWLHSPEQERKNL